MDTRIKDFDLNLLKIFVEIYQTKNLTKVASKLNMTQSGVSRALGRLREQLNDPLFNKTKGELVPTYKATELSKNMPSLLTSIANECFPLNDFSPEQFTEEIKIVVSGALIDVLGIPLTNVLEQLFCNAEIQIIYWARGTLDTFEDSKYMLGISYYPIATSQSIRQVPIFEDEAVVLMRKDHPLKHEVVNENSLTQRNLTGIVLPELSENQTLLANRFKDKGYNFELRSDSLPILYHKTANSDLFMASLSFASANYPNSLIRIPIDWGVPIPQLSVALYYNQKNHQHTVYQLLEKTIKAEVLRLQKLNSLTD